MSSPMFLAVLLHCLHHAQFRIVARQPVVHVWTLHVVPGCVCLLCVVGCACMCGMTTVSIVSIADSRVVSLVVRNGNSQPVSAAVAPRTAVVHRGLWAHGQVLDALRGCSSRCYLHGPVTASPANGELWGGVRTGCSILPLDLFTV